MLSVSSPAFSSSPPPAAAPPAAPPAMRPIDLPEEAREILADGFWRAARERQRQRKGLPPSPWSRRSEGFSASWFRHSFKLDETAANLWGALWQTVTLTQEVLETAASVMGQNGTRHTLLVGHLTRIAQLYTQFERWQGKTRALDLLEQALELLC
jgi:hypothetical protein